MSDPDRATCVRCGAPIPADDRRASARAASRLERKRARARDAAVSSPFPQGARRKRWLAPAVVAIGAILLGGLWIGKTSRRPSDAAGHIDRGNALFGQGKLDEAIAEYRAAIRIKPDFAEAHYNLGVVLANQGKLDEAIAEYREAIRIKPDFAEAHYNLGSALGEPREAGRGDRRIPRGDPDQARLRQGPPQHRRRPGTAGETGRGDRRTPRGDPDQARIAPRPTTTSASSWETRGSWTRPSPNTARRYGSSPTTPRPAPTSASTWHTRGSWRRRSPNTAR